MRPSLTCTHVIALALALASCVLSVGLCGAAQAEASSRHACAAIPSITGLTYDRARKKLIAAGWKPRRTRARDGSMNGEQDFYGNAELFWSRSYVEVGECAGTGFAQCLFTFVDPAGNRLEVETIGEELEDGSGHAKVDRVHLECRK